MTPPLSLVLAFLTLAFQIPEQTAGPVCKEILVRREWRTLKNTEKIAYTSALVKLQNKSDAAGTKGVNFFARIHEDWGHKGIHGCAHFLPWHRYVTWLYEKELRNYNPSVRQHYWDASLDYSDYWAAPIFGSTDADFGTTGTGTGRSGCIKDGPFKNFVPYHEKCLRRAINPSTTTVDPPSVVNAIINNYDRFLDFSYDLEGAFHGQVHNGAGGIMVDSFRSPNEPLFFVHHANVDRLWYIWQLQDAPQRFSDYYGDGEYPEYEDLDSEIYGFPNIKVRDIMNPADYCYTYGDLTVNRDSEYEDLVRRNYGSSPKSDDGEQTPNNYAIKKEACLGELINIQYPTTIPESWIKMNGGSVGKVRDLEKYRHKIIDKLNSLDGFISPSCPVKRKEILLKKITENQAEKLTCYLKGKLVDIPVGRTPEETLEKALEILDQRVQSVSKPSPEKLAAIIGKPCFSANALYNPFQACKGTH